MTITSVTEVIEVIGYQLWRGVLWPYCLGMYRSFNPENWIRRHIRGPIKIMGLHWSSAGYLFAKTMVLAQGDTQPVLKSRGDYTPALSLAPVLSITQETRVVCRDIRAR